MIDSYFRSSYQRLVARPISRRLKALSPLALSVTGGLFGIATAPLLAFGHPLLAIAALALSGLLDTLDGTVARLTDRCSDKGTVLDICCDRTVEFAVVLGLFLAAPDRGLACLLMLGSILLCITSFLVVGIFSENNSEKSFHYSPGLVERAEAFLFFALMMGFPAHFAALAYTFSALVFLTALIRLTQFWSIPLAHKREAPPPTAPPRSVPSPPSPEPPVAP